MGKLTSKQWWAKAAERAIKTFAQAILAGAGTNAILSFASWRQLVIVAITAAILSIFTSIASIEDDSAPVAAAQIDEDIASVDMTAEDLKGEKNA